MGAGVEPLADLIGQPDGGRQGDADGGKAHDAVEARGVRGGLAGHADLEYTLSHGFGAVSI